MSTIVTKKIRKNGREISRGGKILVTKVVIPEIDIQYGFLFNGYATADVRGFANTDNEAWRVPDNADWNGLITYVGGSSVAGKLKATGTDFWDAPNTGAENTYNFDARGAGFRGSNGVFNRLKTILYLGSEQIDVGSLVTYYYIFYNDVSQSSDDAESSILGLSYRLVRTATASEIAEKTDGDYCDDYIGNNGINYKTVFINGQVWTAENSIETKYNNGDPIPEVTVNAQWADLTTGARCSYDNNVNNAFITT